MTKRLCVLIVLITTLSGITTAQETKKKKERKGEIYFSWGYNKEWYTHSTVRVMQPSLGNDYKLKNISGHDHIGWDQGIFSIPLSIPQYNYRLGFLINRKKNLFFEINFDHTKFIISDQNAHLVGTLNNKQVDTTIAFNEANGFFYYLNNGANFLLFNLVKRYKMYESNNKNFKVDGFVKAGIGPLVPHVENMFFNLKNDPHFQIGGWNIGTEAAIRATFLKSVYLEFANKLDFASYSSLGIYQGTARQMFGSYQLILSLGVTIHTGKKVE
ncbi:MAG: hypothetical protein C0459_05210 [Chitinophaga sp.]|jgi:hypothetical protein|nr:hypothetical protein [Chitinophaga sp.]